MRETVNATSIIHVPSGKVWAAISGIDGLDRWLPAISSCRVEGEGVGAVRRLELDGGGLMIDRVDEVNHQERRFRYERTESPFPVSRYLGTVLVNDLRNDQSEVSWTVEIEVGPEARDEMTGFLSAALSGLISGIEKDLQ